MNVVAVTLFASMVYAMIHCALPGRVYDNYPSETIHAANPHAYAGNQQYFNHQHGYVVPSYNYYQDKGHQTGHGQVHGGGYSGSHANANAQAYSYGANSGYIGGYEQQNAGYNFLNQQYYSSNEQTKVNINEKTKVNVTVIDVHEDEHHHANGYDRSGKCKECCCCCCGVNK